MRLFNLLEKIDGSQQIKVIDSNSLERLYEGTKFQSPCVGLEVVGIYTVENTIVIETVKAQRN